MPQENVVVTPELEDVLGQPSSTKPHRSKAPPRVTKVLKSQIEPCNWCVSILTLSIKAMVLLMELFASDTLLSDRNSASSKEYSVTVTRDSLICPTIVSSNA